MKIDDQKKEHPEVANTKNICDIAKAGWKKTPPAFSVGRPKAESEKRIPLPVKRCGNCLQKVARGKPHPKPCAFRDCRQNISEIHMDDPRGAEIFASKIIKDKARSSDSDTITLATAGPSLTVPKPKPSPSKESKALFKDKPIPATELQKMMIVQKMSINQVKNQFF